MACAANFAWENRAVLAHRVRESIARILGPRVAQGTRQVYDVAHNVAKPQPRSAPAHDGDAPIPGRDHRRQRLKPGHRVDDGHRLDHARQAHRLEGVRLHRGEDRKALGAARDRRRPPQPRSDPVDIARARFPSSLTEKRTELGVARGRRWKPRRIQVDVDGQDRMALRVQT
jgi:hypothetical protein